MGEARFRGVAAVEDQVVVARQGWASRIRV